MWFEILPSAGIIFAAFTIPGLGMYYLNKSVLGNPYKRDLRYPINRSTYLRDRRISDSPYKFSGLESIPSN